MIESDKGVDIDSKKKEAWGFYNSGKTLSASKICYELHDSGSADAEITYLLGCCEINSDNAHNAITFFKESLAFNEDSENTPYVYIALASVFYKLGKLEEAEKNYLAAKRLNTNLVEVYLGLAEIHLSKKDLKQSHDNFLKASQIFPGEAFPYFKLGKLAKEQDEVEQSVQWFKKAVACNNQVSEYQEALCESLVFSESFEEAKIACEKALAITPSNIILLGRKSIACGKMGLYSEALSCIETIIDAGFLIADVAVNYLNISKHVDRSDEAIIYAKKCLAKDNIKDSMKAAINTQLALLMDHRGEFSKAWQYITESKKYKRSLDSKVYDPVVQKVITDTQMATFTSATLFSMPTSKIKNDITPIFIVGMPRSGTSLLEQVLAAHAGVSAGGELTYITEIIQNAAKDLNTDTDWPHLIREAKQEHINAFSEKYLSKFAKLPSFSSASTHISDKMPHNFFNLGFIALLFPNAKIIHSRRNALDTCISIYFQNFSNGHEYSDSLFDIGTHYHQYLRLMKHWEENLSIPILNFDYENMVQDPEKNIRNILDFCNLPWDDNCLKFNKLKRLIKTASFDQVKQPIYTKSVERWRNYEQYLDDLHYGLERGY